MTVNYQTQGWGTVTPYLVVEGAEKVVSFIQEVFDARKVKLMREPGGEIMNAEYRIGDSLLMLAESKQGFDMPASFYVFVRDTDATYERALKAGAESLMEPADPFYGDRNAGVRDVTGTCWWIATHVEDVSEEEIARRVGKMGEHPG
jgi:uncharacterized glyoxalase superfamily protein PhnB